MNRILVLVEGPTERAVIEQVFAPDLGAKHVYIYPRVVGKPGHKGGNKFASVRREIKALIHQEPDSLVTMFFDYYSLGDDWPGLEEVKKTNSNNPINIMEKAIGQAIAEDVGDKFNITKFIPYVQIYEIESLLFAGPEEMATVFDRPELKIEFDRIKNDCGGCEKINNNPETAPSKRIMKLFPGYKKGRSVNAHAYRIVQHIGIEKIRQQCPNFNYWYSRLEKLD
jgi:hypothetical protein